MPECATTWYWWNVKATASRSRCFQWWWMIECGGSCCGHCIGIALRGSSFVRCPIRWIHFGFWCTTLKVLQKIIDLETGCIGHNDRRCFRLSFVRLFFNYFFTTFCCVVFSIHSKVTSHCINFFMNCINNFLQSLFIYWWCICNSYDIFFTFHWLTPHNVDWFDIILTQICTIWTHT